MLILVVIKFKLIGDAMIALGAVVALPFVTFNANSVVASVIERQLGTAILAHITVGAAIGAVFAFAAFGTYRSAVCAQLTAIRAEIVNAIGAIMAVIAHLIGTIYTLAAVGTIFIRAIAASLAILAPIFGTIVANKSAVGADIGTAYAFLAILAPCILTGAFAAKSAVGAEFVGTRAALFAAIGTHIGAVFTSLAAHAGNGTVSANSTSRAESICIGAIAAKSAIGAELIRTVGALLAAFHTYVRTVCTSLAA